MITGGVEKVEKCLFQHPLLDKLIERRCEIYYTGM
jgi:hypothetical protein